MAFCGHEDWCSEFNSKRVLQRAKENVEKHYPVVGGRYKNVKDVQIWFTSSFSLHKIFHVFIYKI